jgi:hypothetical protein
LQKTFSLKDLLLITPPFTQLNTPDPATAYIKGFLNTKGISSFQMDLGIEVILKLFSKEGLTAMFSTYNLQPTTHNLIYFDGNHSKKATLDYFELLLPTITNDSVWIFDDIHWSKDMEEAWEIIKNHPKVKVTIDIFQWGIVFFRTQQEKEHFVIRA